MKNQSIDPRPDLKDDSVIWEVVLITVKLDIDYAQAEEAYGLLRGMRSCGCVLKMGTIEQGIIFSFGDEADDEEKQKIKKHAAIHKDYLKKIFQDVWHNIKRSEVKK